jgi:hypothetical protein
MWSDRPRGWASLRTRVRVGVCMSATSNDDRMAVNEMVRTNDWSILVSAGICPAFEWHKYVLQSFQCNIEHISHGGVDFDMHNHPGDLSSFVGEHASPCE